MTTAKRYSGVLLIGNNGQCILQRRDRTPGIVNPGKLTTFGGTAHEFEKPEMCAIREIREELEYNIDSSSLTLLLEKEEVVNGMIVNCTVYICREVPIERLSLKEGEAIECVSVNDDIVSLNLSNLCYSVMSKYRKLNI